MACSWFLHIHIHCIIISGIGLRAYFFFHSAIKYDCKCILFACFTLPIENVPDRISMRRMKMSWKRRSWVFDAISSTSASTFASLTSWGAGMPIGELSWSIAALWSAMSQRSAGAKAFSWLWIVNSMSLNFKPYSNKNSVRFAKHAKRMFQPMNWHQPLQSSTLHLTIILKQK